MSLQIRNNQVVRSWERFTINTFAEAVGVCRQTVYQWVCRGKLNLDQLPYDVITDFWNMRTECTECGKRSMRGKYFGGGVGIQRYCQHCGQPRLKIGITYYVDQYIGNDSNDGVTAQTAFATSSKAMCRARSERDSIVYLKAGL